MCIRDRFNTNMGNTDSGIMGEGKAGTEGIADFNPEDIEAVQFRKLPFGNRMGRCV